MILDLTFEIYDIFKFEFPYQNNWYRWSERLVQIIQMLHDERNIDSPDRKETWI